MNNKLKRTLILLFVVSTLLLMIGSVSAQTDELNENLEASLDLDEEMSVDDVSISNPDSKVSNQLTISNIDEETDTASVNEDLNDLNSNDVVSNNEDTTILAKDSDKNNIKANQLGDSAFIMSDTALNKSANLGDIVSFEIFGRNVGDTYADDIIPIHLLFSTEEFEYIGFTPGVNHEAPDWMDFSACYLSPLIVDGNPNHLMFGYQPNMPFDYGHIFNFTVNFKALKEGNPGTYVYTDVASNRYDALDRTVIGPVYDLKNEVSNQITNVGSIVSFDIFGRNIGANCTELYIPINLLYSPSELQYIGYRANGNSEYYSDPESYDDYPGWDHKIFKYNSNGNFATGDWFNFTVYFKTIKECAPWETFGCFVYVNDWDRGASNSTFVGPDSNFSIDVKALNNKEEFNPGCNAFVNLGSTASFEIFARNLGGTFTEEIVPIHLYFNPDELQYVNFAPGENPDAPWIDFSGNYLEPTLVEAGHLLFGYNCSGDFQNGHCLNFTANFKTLKEGTAGTKAVINWTQGESHKVEATNATIVGHDAELDLSYTPATLIVNVNSTVSFEVFVRNKGGNYNGQWVGIDVIYNPEELEYVNFTPGLNPDDGLYHNESYYTYNEEGPTPNPIIFQPGHLYFGYNANYTFGNGQCFNFTVNFKPLKETEGAYKFMTDASIDWWQIEHHYVNDTAYVFATDAKYVIDIVSLDDLLKIGDKATFEITAFNSLEDQYYGSYIAFDLYFNPDELKYADFTVNEQPRGIFDLETDVSSYGSGNGLLFLADSSDAENGHLKFGYRPTRGANANTNFNFTVEYEVLANGLLKNDAILSWADGEDQKAYSSAAVAAGEYDFNLTKTAVKEQVTVGDDVDFIVYLEHTGTASLYDDSGRILINDWYPGELAYTGFTVNGGSVNGVETSINVVNDTIPSQNKYHLMIYQSLNGYYYNPGDFLNVTLHFKILRPGVHCNHVFFRNYTDFGSVIYGEPDVNLTKTVENKVVELGDTVYFNIFVKNLEDSIPFFDHYNDGKGGLGTKVLTLRDKYPAGLKYIGCELTDYNQAGTLEAEDTGDNVILLKFTPNEDRWWEGSYINIRLAFTAEEEGNFTNTANFYWKWKDWGDEEEIDLTDGDDVLVGSPDFALEKISNFETAKVGDIVSFTIIYTNNGTRTLTGVYIIDNEYSEGLVYYDYSNKSLWTFDGKDKWTYNSDLQPGEAAVLELFFKATSTGQKNNTAIAGNNELNHTLNSTDIVLIKDNETDTEEDEDEPDSSEDETDETDDPIEEEPEENPDPIEEEPSKEHPPIEKKVVLPVVGNPVFVLLLCLISLCFVPLRGKR